MSDLQWFTEGRRQPLLIGKDLAGHRLPFGPYVVWQAAGLLVAPVMWNTRELWGSVVQPLVQVLAVVTATVAAVILIGRYDFAGRNPIWAFTGLLRAVVDTATPRRAPAGTKDRPPKQARSPRPAAVVLARAAWPVPPRIELTSGPADLGEVDTTPTQPTPPGPADPLDTDKPGSTTFFVGTDLPPEMVDPVESPDPLQEPDPNPTSSRLSPLEAFLAAARPSKES